MNRPRDLGQDLQDQQDLGDRPVPKRKNAQEPDVETEVPADAEGASRAQLLEVVEASPALVAAHDKAGWLDLFARSAVVQDPVGTTPCRSRPGEAGGPPDRSELEDFYDTFIAPNAIDFRSHHDVVCPPLVLRDVDIETTAPKGVRVCVPAYLRYGVVCEDGRLKLASLHAYWELRSVTKAVLRGGRRSLRTLMSQGLRMMRRQGFGRALAYSRAFAAGGSGAGRAMAARLADCLQTGDPQPLAAIFAGGQIDLTLRLGRVALRFEELRSGGEPLQIEVERPLSAGSYVAFGFRGRLGGDTAQPFRGIGLLEIDRGRRRATIRRARLYADSSVASSQ